MVRHSVNLLAQILSLNAQQSLRDGFAPDTKPAEYELQMCDFAQDVALLDLREDVGCQLECRVVFAAIAFAEAKITARYANDGIAIGLGERQVRIVLSCVDMQVVRLCRLAL